jgi:hypothetical protein
VLGDIGRYPAMWLWLLSFVLLCMAVARSEPVQARDAGRKKKDRWKVAVALSCVLSIAGLTARVLEFPGPAIKRTVSDVEGIEIRRSGVPPRRYPLLEDGYLRRSKYKFFVLDGQTHESMPGGGWIARPGADSVRYVVHESVESYQLDPEGPGRVLRSTITVRDRGEIIARKTIYDGMVEDGQGWTGAIALKFVQTVLQPPPKPASGNGERVELLVHPLDQGGAPELAVASRRILGCPSSVTLEPRDWREMRTPQWTLQALLNITEIACGEDSLLVVMGDRSGIYVDIISLDGRMLLQARARVDRPADQYAIEAVRADKNGWRVRLVGYRPGPSSNVPVVPIERFEIAIDVKGKLS